LTEPRIHLAFRFHGNFYHSYRGDTPDEFERAINLAQYAGDAPGANLQVDAEAFAYPAAFNGDERLFDRPAHRSWEPTGLGENSNGLGPELALQGDSKK
jgi:hypothetical protein